MKRRRTLLVSLLLVAALCLGIGYAAISETLIINGQTTIEKQDANIKFTACTKTDGPAGSDITGFSAGKEISVNFTGLKNVGDTITANVEISNYNDVVMTVDKPTITISPESAEYIEVTTNWGDSSKDVDANTGTPGTTSFTLTVRLKKGHASETAIQKPFTITFNAHNDAA